MRETTSSVPSTAALVRVEKVTKAYPGVLANDRITLGLDSGQIHAIVGENGSGKSTLMGLLYGLSRPDRGRILISGQEVSFASPRDALTAGVAFVQQTFSLIPTLTVAENLMLASHGAGQGASARKSRDTIAALTERYGVHVRPEAVVQDLSVGERQLAELVKALAFSPRVLLLDEPTSLLTPQQAAQLSIVMRRLASDGIGIFLISHKLEAVLADADHVSVLRRGRVAGSMPSAEARSEVLAKLMIGELPRRAVRPTVAKASRTDEVIMAVDDIWVESPPAGYALEDVSLSVHAGEILGIAGVQDSGQVELTEALAGVRATSRGSIRVGSDVLAPGQVREFRAAGVGHIPADRRNDAMVETMTVEENLVLPVVGRAPFSRFGVIRPGVVRRHAEQLILSYDVRIVGPAVCVGTLSGGNQQKVIVARECSREPLITVCCYPTQGLDFSAMEFVWAQLRSRRAAGASVVLASSDLDELLSLADRILVLHCGRIVGVTDAEDVTAEQLGMMMGGAQA